MSVFWVRLPVFEVGVPLPEVVACYVASVIVRFAGPRPVWVGSSLREKAQAAMLLPALGKAIHTPIDMHRISWYTMGSMTIP